MGTPISIKGPHAVYKLMGSGDMILYIGKTKNPTSRFGVHRHKSRTAWWPLVERYEVTWFPSHAEASKVEVALLREHRPPCNPVIPTAAGKHVTIGKDLKPVRSVWDRANEYYGIRGEPLTMDRLRNFDAAEE